MGDGTPAYCDAERISAGVLFRDCVAALFKFFNALPCSAPNASKIHPKIDQNPPQNLPKPSQNGSKIDPEGLLEPILDQCCIKARSQTPKKQHRSAQECSKEAPDRPKPLPNGTQDSPKSNFERCFDIFPPLQICIVVLTIFFRFLIGVETLKIIVFLK